MKELRLQKTASGEKLVEVLRNASLEYDKFLKGPFCSDLSPRCHLSNEGSNYEIAINMNEPRSYSDRPSFVMRFHNINPDDTYSSIEYSTGIQGIFCPEFEETDVEEKNSPYKRHHDNLVLFISKNV